MKSQLLVALGTVVFVANLSAGVFAIGGFVFDEKNAVTQAAIVQGGSWENHSASRFGRFSPEYISDPNVRTNSFAEFNRTQSIGRLLGGSNRSGTGKDFARAITFPSAFGASSGGNAERCVVQFKWDEGQTLENTAGNDFVIFESATWEGFAVAVKKEGSETFSPYRYQFQSSRDELHDVNAAAFDLSDFGVANGEMVVAIRISNVKGSDKVDDPTGQGKVISATDPDYNKAFVLRDKLGGNKFPANRLDADIVYVTALHNVEPLRPSAPIISTPPLAPGVAIREVSGAGK